MSRTKPSDTVAKYVLPLHKRNITQMGFANHGGLCHGCGTELGFWYNYQFCDRCLSGAPVSVRGEYTGRVVGKWS